MNQEYFRGINKTEIEKAKVIFTGLTIDENCSNVVGTKFAPKRFRELSNVLPPYAMDGTFLGNKHIYDSGDINKFSDIENKAKEIFKYEGFPIFIGGDHSVSIATEKVFIEQTIKNDLIPVVIHLDAHADIMSIYQGNEISHATTNYHAIKNGLDPNNLVMIGIRSYEDIEIEFLEQHNEITVYGIEKIWAMGIEKMLEDIITKYSNTKYNIYLSLDIDCLDPAYAPGTGTPEAFGLSSKELYQIVLTLFDKLNIKAMDIVEISPTADCNDITTYVGIKLFYEILKRL